jgi:hypothetical protein
MSSATVETEIYSKHIVQLLRRQEYILPEEEDTIRRHIRGY